MQEASRRIREDRLNQFGIYRRFQGVTCEAIERRGLPKSGNIRQNYGIVKDYAAALAANIRSGRGLLLAGRVGTMKTTMAVAVLRQWVDGGNAGMLIPMCSLIDNLFTMQALNREEWAGYERRLRSVPLLVLDDLGGENTAQGWVLAKVDSIITERYNKMLPILATTNLSKSDLEGTYSARLMDRLRNTSRYLSFDAASQRRTLA